MSCIGVQENRNTSQEETGKGKKKEEKKNGGKRFSCTPEQENAFLTPEKLCA